MMLDRTAEKITVADSSLPNSLVVMLNYEHMLAHMLHGDVSKHKKTSVVIILIPTLLGLYDITIKTLQI